MIPIVSIFNLISALFFGFVSLKIYLSYKKNKEEKLRNFLKTFIFLSALLFLIASPGLVFKDLKAIGLVYAIYPFFAFLAIAHLGAVPINIMDWQRMQKIFFRGIVLIAFLITLVNIFNWGPANLHYQDSFVYWEDARGTVMNIVLGIVLGLIILLVTLFFIIHGVRTTEKYLRVRAFLIAGGLMTLIITAATNFILGASAQIYITSLVATLLNILAAILIMAGIYYKPKNYA